MAISYVGSGTSSSANTNGGTNTVTVTLPTIQANDFALLFLIKGNTGALTTNPETANGFTQLHTATNSTTHNTYVWYKKLVGSETTLTATWTTAAYNAMGVVVYRGVDETSPFDTTYQVSAFTTNDAAPDFPAITTTGVGAEIVYIANAIKNTSTSAGVTWTAPSGTSDAVQDSSVRNNSLNATVFSSHKNQATIGTVATTSGTVSLNVDYWGYTIALNQKKILQTSGIISEEAFGTVTTAVGAITTIASGIASQEAFGSPNFPLRSVGISSQEAFGTPTASPKTTVIPATIASNEAFGTTSIQLGYPQTLTSAGGIASQAAVGTPEASYANVMYLTGIVSQEAFGTPLTLPQPITLITNGIITGEALGSSTLRPVTTLIPDGIDDSAIGIVGTPTIVPGSVTLTGVGIVSSQAFGSPTIYQVEETWGFLQF